MSKVLDTLLGGGFSYSARNKQTSKGAKLQNRAIVVPAEQYEEAVSQLVLSAIDSALNQVLPIRVELVRDPENEEKTELVFLIPRDVSMARKTQHFSTVTYKAERLASGTLVATLTLGRYLTIRRRNRVEEEGVVEHVVVPIGSIAKVTWHGATVLPSAGDYGWRIVGYELPTVEIVGSDMAIQLAADENTSCYITVNAN